MSLVFLLSGCGIIAEKPEVTPAPEAESQFVFTRENFPVVEGGAALEPLAESVASVMLGESRESVADLGLPAGVRVRVDLDNLEIYADPMVKKVFYNLVDNAVRHGGAVTEIRFSCVKSGQDLMIVCEDDGTGIPEGEKEAVFRETYKRRYGHGLFLVAGILGITGMTIRETGVFGEGARFEVRVPGGGWRGGKDAARARS